MEECIIEGENTLVGQPLSPSAVQGVPWWDGVAHPTVPLDLAHCRVTHQVPQVVHSTLSEVFPGVSSGETGTPAVLAPPATDYALSHTQAHAYAYPICDGIVATYGIQIHPHVFQQMRMASPLEVTEEEPVYVNAKQYRGIMRRRQSRAKAESENKLVKSRKPYLHESRHLHAMRRARGCGGRFLNTKNKEQSKASSESTKSSEDQSSEVLEENDSGQTGGAMVNGTQQMDTSMQ